MKKLIFAAVAVAYAFGVVAPAMAWDYNHCSIAERFVSNKTIAKECHAFIVDRGVIQTGAKKGQFWQDAYPEFNYKTPGKGGVRIEKNRSQGMFGTVDGDKWWKVGDEDAIKTQRYDYKTFQKKIDEYKATHKEK